MDPKINNKNNQKQDQKWNQMHVSIALKILSFLQKQKIYRKTQLFWAGQISPVGFQVPKLTPKLVPKLLKMELTSGPIFRHVCYDFWGPFWVHFGSKFGVKTGQEAPRWAQEGLKSFKVPKNNICKKCHSRIGKLYFSSLGALKMSIRGSRRLSRGT